MTDTLIDTAVDRVPLSFQQDFLRLIDHGDDSGPFGPRYTIVGGWRITGEVDAGVLRGALDDVVARHETLRTSIVLGGDDAYQRVLPPCSPELLVVDLSGTEPGDRDRRAEEFLNDIEAGTFGLCEMPLVRAVLGRFDRRDAVLVLAAHHTAVDGWSIHLVLRDLARFYAARRLHRPVDLPPVRQYREYVAWQRANATGPEVTAARAYWREVLRDARVVPTATDKPRADGEFVTAWHRFLLPEKYRTATLELAGETRSSPFMVLLAAYLTYLRELCGETDLVVPTFTPGRHPAWVLDTVGSFYNFLPLRVDIAGCAGFRDVIARARATCLAAYAHEIPFTHIDAEAPELMSVAIGEHTAASLFQVTQSPHMMGGEQIGDLRVTAMRRRALSAPVGSQIPDGVLWGLEPHPAGGIIGSLGYTTNLFGEATIAGMVSDFRRVLDGTVERGR